MPGTIVEVLVKIGDIVSSGSEVVIIESMKMENPIVAVRPGKVSEILVAQGDFIDAEEPVIRMDQV